MEDKNRKPKKRVPGQSAQKKTKAPPVKPRKNKPVQPEPGRVVPEVVYLPPKPFSRTRFLLRLATVVAVVLALTLALSIFFRVENIQVSGCEKYTPWQVQQASGINSGDQLLTFSRAAAASKILNELPYVKSVRIGISLPNTVRIEIVETAVTYSIQDEDGLWWIMDGSGKVIEQITEGEQTNHTVVCGVSLRDPVSGENARAYEDAQETVDDQGNVIPVTVTAAQRLAALLEITGELERNGILGDAASIDVTKLYDMELWYGTQYRVLLGGPEKMDEKIASLYSVVYDFSQSRPYESGLLDISDPEWIEYQAFTE